MRCNRKSKKCKRRRNTFFTSSGFTEEVIQTFTTSGFWSAPTGVTSVRVQAWGGGAAGGGRTTNGGGGGGGGGAYAEATIPVTPGTLYAFTVGAGGVGTTGVGPSGGTTQWVAGTEVKAVGGVGGGSDASQLGGSGGLDSDSVGTIKFSGGNGGNSSGTTSGGGGGGGAGSGAVGGNGATGVASGVNTAGGIGGSLLGGDGGYGQNIGASASGGPGFTLGGGGGGAYRGSGSRTGGNGARGQIIITYTLTEEIEEIDTNASNQQAFLVLGDSTARGNNGGSGPGPTPTAATAYYFRRSNGTVVQIGANDLEFAAQPPATGSQWPQFGINFNSLTSKKAVVIPCGVAGTNTSDWSETGLYWGPSLADAQQCMHVMGVNKLKAVFIHLGLNDFGSATALSVIEANINSLVTRLQTYFPGTDIVFAMPGRFTVVNSDRIGQIRGYIKNTAINNPEVHILASTLAVAGVNQVQGDGVHLTQTGQNNVGASYARWCANTAYSKWARMVISSHFDELSTARKALIGPLDTHLASYLNHEMLFMFKTTSNLNTFNDWALLSCNLNTAAVAFTANSHIESNGSSTYRLTGYVPAWSDYKSSLTDRFIAVKVKANSTPAGTAGTLVGSAAAAGANGLQIVQTASNTIGYKVNDSTLTEDGTDTSFQADTEYMAARNGGTKYLFKNGIEIDNAAVAATAQNAIEAPVGANNNNGVIDSFLNAQYEYVRAGKHVDTDHAAFIAFLENILDHWND